MPETKRQRALRFEKMYGYPLPGWDEQKYVEDSLGRVETELDIEKKRAALKPKPMTALDSLRQRSAGKALREEALTPIDSAMLKLPRTPTAAVPKGRTEADRRRTDIDSLVAWKVLTKVQGVKEKAKISKELSKEDKLLKRYDRLSEQRDELVKRLKWEKSDAQLDIASELGVPIDTTGIRRRFQKVNLLEAQMDSISDQLRLPIQPKRLRMIPWTEESPEYRFEVNPPQR